MSDFELGNIVATIGVNTLMKNMIFELLERYKNSDFGDLCKEDKEANDEALEKGYRLMGSYTIPEQKIWIITEADRSVTTVLLPEEY